MHTSYGQYLAVSYIKRMRPAVYSSANIGHFGLSLSHYCHFTSPIRRYIDLVVHRLLFSEGENKENLELISQSCSEQERVSAKAENSVTLLKKLRLLDRAGRVDPYKQFDAVVTRVKNFGLYFEILEFMMESYLHVSELENDYYEFNPKAITLKGKHTGREYRAGDKICVMLKEIDFITLDSAWTIVAESAPAAPTKRKKSKAKKKERRRKSREEK
jgi:ribonuclease R